MVQLTPIEESSSIFSLLIFFYSWRKPDSRRNLNFFTKQHMSRHPQGVRGWSPAGNTWTLNSLHKFTSGIRKMHLSFRELSSHIRFCNCITVIFVMLLSSLRVHPKTIKRAIVYCLRFVRVATHEISHRRNCDAVSRRCTRAVHVRSITHTRHRHRLSVVRYASEPDGSS